MPFFTRYRAVPPAEILPAAPRSVDERVDDLDAELSDRVYARAARERALDAISREGRDRLPTDVLLRSHLDDVVEGRR